VVTLLRHIAHTSHVTTWYILHTATINRQEIWDSAHETCDSIGIR